MPISYIEILIFPVFLMVGIFYDFLTLKIPNLYNLFGFALFVPIALSIGLPFDDILLHILISLAVLLVGFGAFAAGFFGGGDSKFLAVIALWIGYETSPLFIFYTALLGGGMAILILICGRLIPAPMQPRFLNRMVERKVIPYGTAMGLATLFVYQDTWIWTTLMS